MSWKNEIKKSISAAILFNFYIVIDRYQYFDRNRNRTENIFIIIGPKPEPQIDSKPKPEPETKPKPKMDQNTLRKKYVV